MDRARLGAARYAGPDTGHYESWFQRANHPTEPIAFWIRYTVFVPAEGPREPMGELWVIVFERGAITARKAEFPVAACRFDPNTLDVRIGASTLDLERCEGGFEDVRWSLGYTSDAPPLLMLPERLYRGGFPKAKLLVGSPMARYRGSIQLGERELSIDGWVGSQNHNWGSQHTDRYAWGQVAGFDDRPDVFLEAATAWLKFGPVWTPPLTIASVRVGEHTVQRVGMLQAVRGRAAQEGFGWSFRSRGQGVSIEATFDASADDFVAIRYLDPPSGHKACLNSKLARCQLRVESPQLGVITAHTRHRAAFELLRDEAPPGMTLLF